MDDSEPDPIYISYRHSKLHQTSKIFQLYNNPFLWFFFHFHKLNNHWTVWCWHVVRIKQTSLLETLFVTNIMHIMYLIWFLILWIVLRFQHTLNRESNVICIITIKIFNLFNRLKNYRLPWFFIARGVTLRTISINQWTISMNQWWSLYSQLSTLRWSWYQIHWKQQQTLLRTKNHYIW